jgi:hypothetical protein
MNSRLKQIMCRAGTARPALQPPLSTHFRRSSANKRPDNFYPFGLHPALADDNLMTQGAIRPGGLREPRLGLALLIGLIVLVAAGKPILFDTMDPDCFWHLLVGKQLRSEHIGPIEDKLSFSSLRDPWTPYSWLAELGMDCLWRAGGWRAAILAQAIFQAAFITFIALACRARPAHVPRKSRFASDEFTTDPTVPGALESAVAAAAAAFLSLAYLSFRPVTAALVLLALCGWLIVRDRRSGERTAAVWFLIPLTVLLINLHLYAVLVPMWIGALWVGAILERRWADPEHRPEAERRASRYGWLLVATGAACLATPMLPGVISTAFHYQAGDPMVASGFIAEMRPFYHGVMGNIAAGVVAVMTLFALINFRRLRIGDWLWLALGAAFLLRLGRFAPTFAIIAAPIFARTLMKFSPRILARPAVCALMALVLAAGLVRLCMDFPRSSATFDTWLNRHGKGTPGYPCAAADYIAANVNPATGQLINEFTWGGYLEWRLGDRYQTLLDGRTQCFAPEFWVATYLGSEKDRSQYFARTHADAALLPIERSVFAQTLKEQNWKVVYSDDRAQVLLPPPGLNKDAKPKWPFAGLMFGE